MDMENRVNGNSSGAGASQGPSSHDLAALYLFEQFRYIIQPASEPPAEFLTSSGETVHGVPLRDIDGEVVAVMEMSGDVVLMPDGQRIASAEIENAAAPPPPPPPTVAKAPENKIAEGDQTCGLEDNFPTVDLPEPEEMVCRAPEDEGAAVASAMQSFAPADFFTGEENQLMCVWDGVDTQTERSASRFAESPTSKPAPKSAKPKQEPVKETANPSPVLEDEEMEPAKNQLLTEKPKEPVDVAKSEPSAPEEGEASAVVVCSATPEPEEDFDIVPEAGTPDSEMKASFVPLVQAPEEAQQFSAQVCMNGGDEAVSPLPFSFPGFEVAANETGNVHVSHAAESAMVGGALCFGSRESVAAEGPGPAAASALKQTIENAASGRRTSDVSFHASGEAGETADRIFASNSADNLNLSGRILSVSVPTFRGSAGTSSRIGAFLAVLMRPVFESDSEKDTAKYGGMPNFGALIAMLFGGRSFDSSQMKSVEKVAAPEQNRDSGDHQGGDGQKGEENQNDQFYADYDVDEGVAANA